MEHKKSISNLSAGHRILVLSLVLFTFLAAAYGLFILYSKPVSTAFLSVTDLPQGASLQSFLETSRSVTELSTDDPSVELSQSLTPPYRLNTSVKLPEDQYRDFSITVTSDKISVVTDGFHAGDLVSLDINGKEAFGRMPSDWSGKLELATTLPPEQKISACVYVAGKSESFGLCHAVPERRPL